MKRVFCILLAALTLLPLAACAARVHSIETNCNVEMDDILSVPRQAKAGETVEIRSHVLYDADIDIYVDGEMIRKSHNDSDYWAWEFKMPDRGVKVEAKLVNGFLP